MDVFLGLLFPLHVVFAGEREWCVVCDVVADFLASDVLFCHVLGVEVDRGGDVVPVPFCLLGRTK